VVTTYNNPRYLELVLLGYARQTRRDFEVVVADDGSRDDTRALIDRMRDGYPVPLVHAWQPDVGFRQSRVLDWGALHARAAHLIFTDGDCVPPAVFVEEHLRAAAPRTLVVGGHVRLTPEQTETVTPDMVRAGRHEALLTAKDRWRLRWRHVQNRWYIATGARRRPKIQGLNFSIDRPSFYAVNGFDLRYENNARQDSDLRNRLRLWGAGARCIWHRCIVFHLHHPVHKGRHAWTEADAYYHRADLEPVAAQGIRELAAETGRVLPRV
jgi:glycosyltransferase involved in cell wall biosynthesis